MLVSVNNHENATSESQQYCLLLIYCHGLLQLNTSTIPISPTTKMPLTAEEAEAM